MNSQLETNPQKKQLQPTRPMVIFGASVVGEAIWHACHSQGLHITAFCDNNIWKAAAPLLGTEVIHTAQLQQRFPDACFIIAVIDIGDIVEQLGRLGFQHWLPASDFLSGYDIAQHTYTKSVDFVKHVVTTCILSHNSYAYPDRIYLHSVDVVITERCSLRCRDCANLMQYYNHPQDATCDSLFRTIDTLCSVTDTISEARVIGGEPLMHKKWAAITRYLLDKSNIDKVVVYTNATMVPAPAVLDAIASPKLLFIVTDYGELSRNIEPLCQNLERTHILYVRSVAAGWTDCSTLAKHQRSEPENRKLFQDCCAKNLFTLKDSRLYRCPFAANATALKAAPAEPNDWIEFTANPPANLRDTLKHFVHATTSIASCDFCNGRRLDDPAIEPAKQTLKPLPYQRLA